MLVSVQKDELVSVSTVLTVKQVNQVSISRLGKQSITLDYRRTFSIKDRNVICGQLCFRLDPYQKWGPSPCGNAFSWEVLAFEGQGECSFLETFEH